MTTPEIEERLARIERVLAWVARHSKSRRGYWQESDGRAVLADSFEEIRADVESMQPPREVEP